MKRGPWVARLPYPEHLIYVTSGTLASRCGVSPATIFRWKAQGVPHASADLLADAIGLHPLNIWPNYHQTGNTCPRGHEWDGFEEKNVRRCRTCRNAKALAYYYRHKDQAA